MTRPTASATAPVPVGPPLASIEWDADGRVVEWSPEAERLFGWTAAEVCGKRSAEWGFVHPDDRARVMRVADDLARGRARQTFSSNRNLARDGRVLHCEWYNTALLDDAGEVAAQFSLVLDVTDRVHAEERARAALGEAEETERRFRTMAESIPQLAWMADPDGAIFWYNQRWYEYTGTRPEEVLGWGWDVVHHPERVEGVRDRFLAAVRAGNPWEDTFPLRGTDGGYRRFLSRALPLRAPDGRVVRWFGTNTDVEEQLRAQEARDEALAQAEAARAAAEDASRTKSVFLATMSHEIRTPINAVIGYADLLEMGLQGALNEGQLGYVGRIRASSRHLLGLVNDVLDFARVEAGSPTFEYEVVPLAEVVVDAVAMVLPQASARGIALIEEPCEPDAAFLADGDRVRQVLLNLLSNAVKFTRPGGTVTIRCERAARPPGRAPAPAEGGWAAVQVEDTGIGIAPEHLERVFEPFTQVDASHTREAGGTGLGLAISRRYARLMGGDLEARSQPGTGSVFTLRLPSGAEAAVLPAPVPAPVPAELRPHFERAGRAIEEAAEAIVDAWVGRVVADRGIPSARGLNRTQVEDHSTTFVTELGRSLTLIGGGGDSDRRDGASIQRTIAALHGAQRARLGFAAGEVGRDYRILGEEVEAVLAATGTGEGAVIETLRGMLDHAERVAVESHAAVPRSDRLLGRTQQVIEQTAETVRRMRAEMERREGAG